MLENVRACILGFCEGTEEEDLKLVCGKFALLKNVSHTCDLNSRRLKSYFLQGEGGESQVERKTFVQVTKIFTNE